MTAGPLNNTCAIAVTTMATTKERKPTEVEREEAFKVYWEFRGRIRAAILALCRVRLQRYAGLSYVEAVVQSRWRITGTVGTIAKIVDRSTGDVWRINDRAERKMETAGYKTDYRIKTWISQTSSFFTYSPSVDPLFGDITEPYCRYSR